MREIDLQPIGRQETARDIGPFDEAKSTRIPHPFLDAEIRQILRSEAKKIGMIDPASPGRVLPQQSERRARGVSSKARPFRESLHERRFPAAKRAAQAEHVAGLGSTADLARQAFGFLG
jgi:hypothetical protein